MDCSAASSLRLANTSLVRVLITLEIPIIPRRTVRKSPPKVMVYLLYCASLLDR